MIRKLIPTAAFAALSVLTALEPVSAQQSRRGPIDALQSVFGVAPDPTAPGRVLLATEYGLLRAAPDGFAEVLPQVSMAVVGLAPVAGGDAGRLLLSGFGENGEPGGILRSEDGGRSWTALPGTDGRDGVAVTSLSVSRVDPDRVAGLAEEIMLSSDGGATWVRAGATPKETLAVAMSGTRAERIYAGTMTGLRISDDGGQSWAEIAVTQNPVTAVASLSGGRVGAFVYGTGFMIADEAGAEWTTVASGFEDRYLRALVEAPGGTIYGVADTGAILLSRDGGVSWISFEGSDLATPERIAAGKALFAETCQTCHGVGGIGESPDNPTAQDEFGFKAPALNNDMHAWHHSDAGLRATIREGSPRNERMIAWKEKLTDQQIDSIIAYLKSTWSVRSLACQGSRHMRCN